MYIKGRRVSKKGREGGYVLKYAFFSLRASLRVNVLIHGDEDVNII